uniref:Uncharacterized protein n=1 Tax=Arundo donax TaxID=35708 RepID=A0A0A9EQY8_ARUDO
MVHVRRRHVVQADLADLGNGDKCRRRRRRSRVFASGRGCRRWRRGDGVGALNYGKGRRLRHCCVIVGGGGVPIKLWRVRGLCRSSRHGGGNNHLLELQFRGVVLVG